MTEELKNKINEILKKGEYTEEDKKVFKEIDNIDKLIALKEMIGNYSFDSISNFLPENIRLFLDLDVMSDDDYNRYKNYLDILTNESLNEEQIKELQNIPTEIVAMLNPYFLEYMKKNDIDYSAIETYFLQKKVYDDKETFFKKYGINSYKDYMLFLMSLNDGKLLKQIDSSIYFNLEDLETVFNSGSISDTEILKIEELVIKNINNIDIVRFLKENYGENKKISKELLDEIKKNVEKIVLSEPNIIDYISEDELTDEIMNLAYNNGYVINENTPDKIKNNIIFIKNILSKNSRYNIDILTFLPPEILDQLTKAHFLNISIGSLRKEKLNIIARKSMNAFLSIMDCLNNSDERLYYINSLKDDLVNDEVVNYVVKRYSLLRDHSGFYVINLYNQTLLKMLMKRGYLNIIDCVREDVLNDENIKLAIEKGYVINNYTSVIIRKNPEYIKIFIEYGQKRASSYAIRQALNYQSLFKECETKLEKKILDIKENMNNMTQQSSQVLTRKDIIILFYDGYRIDNNTPEFIRSNLEYIMLFMELGQANAIDYATEGALSEDNIELAIKEEGYIINDKTPNKIRSNAKFIKMLIKCGQVNAIDYATEGGLTEEVIILAIEKGYNFRQIKKLVFLLDKVSSQSLNKLDQELIVIYNNTKKILDKSGKVNTLDRNPVLSYDVVKYIYPVFGIDFTLNIIKYNTTAANNIVNELMLNNEQTLRGYLKLINSFGLFPYNAEGLHFAFQSYDKIKILIEDVLNNENEVTIPIMNNLKKVILNRNHFMINTFEDLKNYNLIVKQYNDNVCERKDIEKLKDEIAILFGFSSFKNNLNYHWFKCMEIEFNGYQFDNFKNLCDIINEILENVDKSEKEVLKEKIFFTKDEICLILIMKDIIRTNNLEELIEIFKKFTERDVDFSDQVNNLKNKIRLIYNYHLKFQLTDVEKLKEKAKINNVGDVEVIEPSINAKFNFLAHRLYNYDPSNYKYCEMIRKDPSLWTQLEGASTLSTSSISEKGFWMLNATDCSGVIYLFNDTLENSLLYMYERDLYTEHGGHLLEPSAKYNLMTDINTLNQKSAYRHCTYNEVSVWREGMMPCAIACVGDLPNEDSIRAAKYFKIPIIKFDINAYNIERQKNQEKAIQSFSETLNYNDMYNYFYDGLESPSLEEKIDTCLKILSEKHKEGNMDIKIFLNKIIELEKIINRIGCGTENGKKILRRLELYKQSMCMIIKLTDEEIIDLETAQMGETGIMYILNENDKKYLIKPAVDKQYYESQAFRAEIQTASSKLQKALSSDTAVNVETIGTGSLRLSKQPLINVDKEETNKLNVWSINGGDLKKEYKDALLREYVVDFLLCNFDSFSGNFIIDENGNLKGIDKEQSFRFINDERSLDPSFSYVPNGESRIPIYKLLFERYQNNEIDLNLEIVNETLQKLSEIKDDEYRELFRKYAETLNSKNVEQILDAIVDRKNKAINIIYKYIEQLKNSRGDITNDSKRM